MNNGNASLARLARVKALWMQLGRTKHSTSDYEALMKQIRTESDAYKAFTCVEPSVVSSSAPLAESVP